MTINALPSQLQPVTNKRNASLLAKELNDILGVAPERGCIMFRPVLEECFARGGLTVAGEIEELERAMSEEGRTSGGVRRSGEKGLNTPSRGRKKKSTRSLKKGVGGDENLHTAIPIRRLHPDQRFMLGTDGKLEENKREEVEDEDPMPLPERKFESDIRKVSKRKSFIKAVFRKY